MALTRPKYSQIYDTDWKQSVELATTADVGNLVLANVQPNSIDGVTVLTNYRILVKDQNSGAQNGIYLVRSAGTGSNGWWSRSLDALTSDRVTAGLAVNVISGSVNGGKEFKLTTPDPITLGTTVLTFIDPNASAGAGGANAQVQFNDASVLNGSAGLTFNKFSNTVTISNTLSTSNFTLGSQQFYSQGTNGFSVNENYDPSANSLQTAYHFTSGAGREEVAFTLARTGQFTDGFGVYGTSADNTFVNFGEQSNTKWEWRSGIGIQPLNLDGGTLRMRLYSSGNLAVSGNVSATYFTGNGALLTGIVAGSSYSNVQVAAYLPTYTGNIGKIYYDPNNGFVGFNDTSPDYVYDFYTPDNAGEILHIEGGVGTQAYFGARNSSGLNYTAGADQNYAFSGTKDTTNDYALITNNLVRANIQGSSGNVIFTQSITVANDVITKYLGVEEFRSTDANITVRSDMIFIGQELSGMAKLAVGTENPGSEAFTVLGGSSYFDRDVTISGNLFVNGNTTTFTSNNITLKDSLIYLADENPADTVDIGFVGSFNNIIRYQHTGFVRDATDGTWKLFANVVPEPTTTVDFTNATYSNLQVGNLTLSGITPATSSTTGALQVVGGAGILGNLHVGIFGATPVLSAKVDNFGAGRPVVVITGNIIQGSGGTLTYVNLVGNVTISNTAPSTNTTGGALVVTGGAGIGGNINAGGNIQDSKGDVRSAPQNSQSGAYVLVATDAGKHISITTGGVTVNASIFSIGDMVTIYNNSGSSQNITQGTSVTLRLAGTATTGTRALAQYGVSTLLCVTGGASPVFACTGAGLT